MVGLLTRNYLKTSNGNTKNNAHIRLVQLHVEYYIAPQSGIPLLSMGAKPEKIKGMQRRSAGYVISR